MGVRGGFSHFIPKDVFGSHRWLRWADGAALSGGRSVPWRFRDLLTSPGLGLQPHSHSGFVHFWSVSPVMAAGLYARGREKAMGTFPRPGASGGGPRDHLQGTFPSHPFPGERHSRVGRVPRRIGVRVWAPRDGVSAALAPEEMVLFCQLLWVLTSPSPSYFN